MKPQVRPEGRRLLQGVAALVLIMFPCLCPAGTMDYFTDNGYGNPLSTLQHPCAEHYQGVTYIAYQGPHEDPYVCAYDHTTGKWLGPVKAGINPMGRTPDPTDRDRVDNHGRPALIVDGKGYIHLVFGGHGGSFRLGRNPLGAPGKGRQTHVVSTKPQDIASWEVVHNISPFGTYSQFVKMAEGDIYLFYRHGSHRSDWVYQKSTDDARTFAPPVSVLKHKARKANPNIHDAWYAWFDNGQGDTVTASYIYHPCAIIGHTKERYNGYYMQMNGTDESWHNACGDALVVPVTKEYADAHTLVCNTGKERSKRGTCRVDNEGRPHVFFRQGGGQVRYYRWLGAAWQGPVAVTDLPGSQDGDMIVESPEVARILLSVGNSDTGEVSWWKTMDGGLSWQRGESLIQAPNVSFVVSSLVRNAHPDGQIVAYENNRAQDHLYRKLFLLGDSGPVGRREEEARNLGTALTSLDVSNTASKSGKGKNSP